MCVYNRIHCNKIVQCHVYILHEGALGHGIDVSGLPAGVYNGHIEATDVFGSSASSSIVYQGNAQTHAV